MREPTLQEPPRAWWHSLVPVSTGDISPAGHVRLLEMTYERLRYSVLVTPFGALPVVWYFRRFDDGLWLFAWCLFYVGFALFVFWLDRWYRRDRSELSADAMLRRWKPLLGRIATVHGLGLTAATAVTAAHAPIEFMLLIHLILAGTVAANATHQTPLIGVFLRFLGATATVLLLAPYAFKDRWPLALPLATMFTLAIYKHALTAHRFFVEQVRLEERSQTLAQQSRDAQEAAELALQEKNRFLATASHDLRQPMHAMSMLVAALQTHSQDATLRPLLSNLKTSTDSLSLMFDSLLNLSSLEAGRIVADPRYVDLTPLLNEAAALYREQARSLGLQLRVHVPRNGDTLAFVDASLLRQALVNLVHNALRFTRAGGVLLAARRRGMGWSIEVWDTGMGVATEEQSRIFSPYYRGDQAWPVNAPGHGLGLSVVARGADLLGIEYGMRSQLGRGSCFWLRLRGADALGVAAMTSEPVSVRPTALHGRCLVLDDDPHVIAAWQVMLAAWGVQARCVADGMQAFAALDQGFVPQAIFCDQRLRSGESGFELLQALLARCPEASGAMVSGEFDSSALHAAEADGYLVLRKPVDPEQVHALLARWLQGR